MVTSVEIKAGPELDREVAKAAGYRCSAAGSDDGVLIDSRDVVSDAAAVLFHPSEDLNAAFAAADRVGLFGNHDNSLWLMKDRDLWCVLRSEPDDFLPCAEAPTPALAICAAILKVTGK